MLTEYLFFIYAALFYKLYFIVSAFCKIILYMKK